MAWEGKGIADMGTEKGVCVCVWYKVCKREGKGTRNTDARLGSLSEPHMKKLRCYLRGIEEGLGES